MHIYEYKIQMYKINMNKEIQKKNASGKKNKNEIQL